MMTVHKLSAGDGYKYYTHEVASGDALRANDRELGDYYTVDGMPPGQWIGSAPEALGLSGEVSEAHMHTLFGQRFTPIETVEVAEMLHGLPEFDDYMAAYNNAYESYKAHAAERAWEILTRAEAGISQQEIAHQMGEIGHPMTQKTVSNYLTRYAAVGNKITSAQAEHNGKNGIQSEGKALTKEEFIERYRLTPGEITAAHNAGKRAHNKLYKEQTASQLHPEYGAGTDFTKRVSEEVARHRRTHDGAEPTKAQMQEIRFRVGGELYRAQRGIEPTHAQLRQFIAENSKKHQTAIAGFDLVFTPSKSVSIAWGLGDKELRKSIEAAHEHAIQDVVRHLESNVVMTRRGHNGIRQIDTKSGIIGTKFRHYDSRAGDPNLHDHVVIANRVEGADDKWSSIDGRTLYQYGVECSELYNSRVQQYVTEKTGLQFEPRMQNGKPIHEIVGISDETIRAFSSRRGDISAELDRVKAKFVADNGYEPSEKQLIKLAQQATLATRPAKSEARSLEDLHTEWVAAAHALSEHGVHVPVDHQLAESLKNASLNYEQSVLQGARQEAYSTPLEAHTDAVLSRLEEARSTWRRTHINAETTRYVRELGLNETQDKGLISSIRQSIVEDSLLLHIKDTRLTPREYLRKDGTSQYQRIDAELFTSERVLAAENKILDAASRAVIPASTVDVFELAAQKRRIELATQGHTLPAGQEAMARAFATSDKFLVVGIGAAGAGKTSSTRLAVDAIEASGNRVIGMAPTAAAAAVMRSEMRINADTVDKILTDWQSGKKSLDVRPGDVLLVDEAGMIATPKMEKILTLAQERGALVRALGDYRQLSAVGSGGALRLVDREIGAVHLDELFRFKNPEEAAATLSLREPPLVGTDKPFEWYKDNNRVVAGDADAMIEDVFRKYSADVTAGKQSIMIASTNETVTRLNDLAQAHAIEHGQVNTGTGAVALHNSSRAHVGDTIVTRKNARRLIVNSGQDFVKNGDLWRVTGLHDDGRITAQHTGHGGKVTLPASYVEQSVELGYAATIHRAQGSTVDTAHALVDASTDRAGAYVALTRGRENNQLYVSLADGEKRDDVLDRITGAYERDLTVHETVDQLRAEHRNIASLIAQHEDISELAVQKVMEPYLMEGMSRVTEHPVRDKDSGQIIDHTPANGVEDAKAVLASPAWPALAHDMGEAYRAGVDPAALVERAYSYRPLEASDQGAEAKDYAAVMQWRVEKLNVDAQKVHEMTERPLSYLSNEHLAKLVDQAAQRNQPMADRLELSDPWWFTNPYAMVKTDELMAMRSRTFKALQANENDGGLYEKIKENLGDMDAEVQRRRWEISGDQRELEQIIRGERPRSGHNFTLHKVLSEEQKVRQHLIPTIDLPETKRPEQIQNGISGHTLDRFWENHPHLHNTRLGTILRSRSREIGQLAQVRGAQLAAEKPEWVKQLGDVPANKKLARHWYRVAAETEALRDKYNIAPSDPEAVPQKLRTQAKPHEAPSRTEARGKFLHAQVVSTHKRSVMAAHHRTPKTNIENVQLAQARDTNLRAQEAHREGRPAGITTAMLSPEQRKHLQKMRAEKASQTTRKEKIMQQPAQPSVEQRIADQRKQRSNRAQELARLKERAQKGLEASKQKQTKKPEQPHQQKELHHHQRNIMDQQRQQQSQRGIRF
ncbi:MobF family relaxase [Rothia dentocariosa]|uniref:MobF family relaxase n=1 Tax=Rothia dentocariosa TaxID=2047 RepID=UPI0002E29B35|nr:MobF family relaxase [Rothia dentocariosa]QKI10040.1 relaxase domain-containing protein [Rothia dentocariosa]